MTDVRNGTPPLSPWSALTEREAQILSALADGDRFTDIAAEMHVSVVTVRTYAQGLYGKLHAKTAAHAVALAYHRGMLVASR